MKPKMILKILVDLAMTVLLFLLMAYLLVERQLMNGWDWQFLSSSFFIMC